MSQRSCTLARTSTFEETRCVKVHTAKEANLDEKKVGSLLASLQPCSWANGAEPPSPLLVMGVAGLGDRRKTFTGHLQLKATSYGVQYFASHAFIHSYALNIGKVYVWKAQGRK